MSGTVLQVLHSDDPSPTTPTSHCTYCCNLLAEALTLSLRDALRCCPFLRDSQALVVLITQGRRQVIKTITRHIMCTTLMIACYSGAAAVTLTSVELINAELEKMADARIEALTK